MGKRNDYLIRQLLEVNRHELFADIKKTVKKKMASEFNGDQYTRQSSVYSNYRYFYDKFTKFFVDYKVKNIMLTDSGVGQSFRDYLINNLNLQNGYAYQIMGVFVATLNMANLEHRINRSKLFKGYSVKKWESEEMFLDDTEIQSMLDYSEKYHGPKYECEGQYVKKRQVLDAFILSLFTGARKEEVPTVEMASDNRLRYISQKTKQEMVVANHPKLEKILMRGLYRMPLEKKRYPYYKALGAIFRRCNIYQIVHVHERRGKKKITKQVEKWRAISFHTARKTYGKMLLDRGVDIYTVSKLLGHASVKITERAYAAVNKEEQVARSEQALKNI